MNIKFDSKENEVLLNPRMTKTDQAKWMHHLAQVPNLESHVWISTSGSSGAPKWAALSKQALLTSAKAVNQHLSITSNDRWLNPLPTFHVGGLGIIVRASLSKSRLFTYHDHWHPATFQNALISTEATLTSLVPTQVYDLVAAKLTAPKTLRGCIVGGGALTPSLQTSAKELGWPLLPSYGLTECCSQVATALEGNSNLKILPHVQCRIGKNCRLSVKSDSLLTLYAVETEAGIEFLDPKVDGWFETEDKAEIVDDFLHIHGRESHFIKIGGESVNLSRLRALLEEQCLKLKGKINAALIAVPDERLGHVIHLTLDQESESAELIHAFNSIIMPYERIRHTHVVTNIPLTGIGKIDYNELQRLVGCAST